MSLSFSTFKETVSVTPVASEISRVTTVATLAARDALTAATGMRVYVTATNRTYYWDGSKWLAPEELFGILNLIDFGLVSGGGSAATNNAAWNALVARMDLYGTSEWIVIVPKGFYDISQELCCKGTYSHEVSLRGTPGTGGSIGSHFRCQTDLGASAYTFSIDHSALTQTGGSVEGVAFEGPGAAGPILSTTTTANVTFPANSTTTFTLSVSSTTGYDTPGTPSAPGVRGAPGPTARIVVGGVSVYYTGKTANTFTGCTVQDNFGVTKNSGSTVVQDQTYGSYPAQMRGIRWGGSMKLTNVRVSGFMCGLSCEGDHQIIRDSYIQGNGIGCYIPAIAGMSIGDQRFDRAIFDGNYVAHIAVGAQAGASDGYGGQILDDACFTKTHFAGGPFAFYVFPGAAANTTAFSTLTMAGGDFEAIGNMIAYDEGGNRTWSNFVIDNCVCSYDDNHRNWSYPGDVSIDVGNFYTFRINGYPAVGKRSAGAIRARQDCGTCSMESPSPISANPTVPFLTTPVLNAFTASDGDVFFELCQNGPAVSANDLVLQDTAARGVIKGTSGKPVGVALHAVTPASNAALGIQRGNLATVNSTGTINRGDYVKPDPSNAGKVVASTGWSDGPIVGTATAPAGGGTVQVRLMLG